MHKQLGIWAMGSLMLMGVGNALADNDIEGAIEAIQVSNQTFVVKGITFHTTPTTDYDDDLQSFADLRVGQQVEVDFVIQEGKYYATEIELDD